MNDEELTELFGSLMQHSEYKRGEIITFREGGKGPKESGMIVWVTPPGPSYEGGPDRPLIYWADMGAGMPRPVYQWEIVVE